MRERERESQGFGEREREIQGFGEYVCEREGFGERKMFGECVCVRERASGIQRECVEVGESEIWREREKCK